MAFGTDALEEPSGYEYDETIVDEMEEYDDTDGVHRKSTTFQRDPESVPTWSPRERSREENTGSFSARKARSQPLAQTQGVKLPPALAERPRSVNKWDGRPGRESATSSFIGMALGQGGRRNFYSRSQELPWSTQKRTMPKLNKEPRFAGKTLLQDALAHNKDRVLSVGPSKGNYRTDLESIGLPQMNPRAKAIFPVQLTGSFQPAYSERWKANIASESIKIGGNPGLVSRSYISSSHSKLPTFVRHR